MKRDMDLVRDLMLKIEASEGLAIMSDFVPTADRRRFRVASYHMKMLIQEIGLVKGVDVGDEEDLDWIDLELTWRGHDFLDAMRDPTVWEKTREGAKKLGGVTFDMFLGIAKELAKAEAKKRLGLDL
jgi:hypothetical protein